MPVTRRVGSDYVRDLLTRQLAAWLEVGYTTRKKEVERFSSNLKLLTALTGAAARESLPGILEHAESMISDTTFAEAISEFDPALT